MQHRQNGTYTGLQEKASCTSWTPGKMFGFPKALFLVWFTFWNAGSDRCLYCTVQHGRVSYSRECLQTENLRVPARSPDFSYFVTWIELACPGRWKKSASSLGSPSLFARRLIWSRSLTGETSKSSVREIASKNDRGHPHSDKEPKDSYEDLEIKNTADAIIVVSFPPRTRRWINTHSNILVSELM